MRLGIASIITAALLVTAVCAQPTTQNLPTFAPKNDLYISANEKTRSTVTEYTFNELTQKLKEIYAPIFKKNGGELVMLADWEDGTVNAYTQRLGNKWAIRMFGGLARMRDMTEEGLVLVICHEIGHQIGGLPKQEIATWGISWAAAEGQSDYFATSKCMKRFFEGQDNQEIVKNLEATAVAIDACGKVYENAEDKAICIRSAMAGEALGLVLSAMSGSTMRPVLHRPSSYKVTITNTSAYPSTQCRVDTYFQGALCDRPFSIEASNTDIHQGYCARENGYTVGTRPLCWFNPEDTI